MLILNSIAKYVRRNGDTGLHQNSFKNFFIHRTVIISMYMKIHRCTLIGEICWLSDIPSPNNYRQALVEYPQQRWTP